MNTFYWHDYETWGTNPAIDRPSQFAGVRTDENLNIIDAPLVIYCRPPEDIWPHPEACLITGITPQKASVEGLSESDFIARIHQQLAQAKTCGVGYNTLRFDDEVTRYTLYRNFYDPYEREWNYGNSRWDIIDMVRLVYALRPDGIEWPTIDDKPSFKLENLCIANGISHESAHDAYSDVEATINLAKLIRQKKPALYDYVLNNKSKQAAASFIDVKRCKPLLHISSKFPSSRGCAGLIAPLAMHPVNKNAVIVYDLAVDPSPLAHFSPEEIRDRVFIAQEDLPEGEQRLPIKLIHLNKCPILATTKLLDQNAAARHGIDKAQCEAHWHMLKKMNVGDKLKQMYRLDAFVPSEDPECQLYDGFIPNKDKQLMTELRAMTEQELASTSLVFEDTRLNDMVLRYKARNFPTILTSSEKEEWQEFVTERLSRGGDRMLSREQFCARVEQLKYEYANDAEKQNILYALEQYSQSKL